MGVSESLKAMRRELATDKQAGPESRAASDYEGCNEKRDPLCACKLHESSEIPNNGQLKPRRD
jgi:hypothetical protein